MNPKPITLIQGGQLVLPDTVIAADLLIRGEKVAALGDFSGQTADRTYDARGMLILPGGVDNHVHFNDSFMNTVSVHDFYTGTRAAAFGGTTTVVDFANQTSGGSLMEALGAKKEEARGAALVDYGIHPCITRADAATLAEIPQAVAAGAPTMKCYMTYRQDGLMMTMEDLSHIQVVMKEAGGMLMVHAEDDALLEKHIGARLAAGQFQAYYHAASRPPEVEEQAIRDLVHMLGKVGGRLFIVHLASDQGLQQISRARAAGMDISAETCIHYLIFTRDVLRRDDGIKWICSPPLRGPAIQDALWQGLADGRLALVSTDDAAFSWAAKLLGKERFDQCPNGIPGIEVRLSLLYSQGVAQGRISLPQLAELTAAAPARKFGMYPEKGTLLPGSDADLVLLDPEASWTMGKDTLHMGADWSAYENISVKGRIEKVFSRGELIIDRGNCLAARGRGRYLHRKLA